ncbi:(3S,6E)-nerolidol synthase 1-like [Humulus lupulus]|uniref:(3S,6E)-nerolidol synthase 1-like n=1 Tax=Humulus lupulus TaxID=3486 RepID=UPI002B403A4D|nr:(3S,6E)-nerolidol synthase 1-like [Humulus lupulus]
MASKETQTSEITAINPTTTPSKQPYGLQSFTDKFYMEYARNIQEIKNVMNNIILADYDHQHSIEGLNLVNAVLRLGIDYHFQDEINAILEREHLKISSGDDDVVNHGFYNNNNVQDYLYDVSLRFRLLRQGGYDVSTDVFNELKDKKGNFNPSVAEDREGLRELFEASQVRIEGEHVLEEAEVFSGQHLKEWANRNNHTSEARTIQVTLEQPCHKSLARITAPNFLESLFPATRHQGWMTLLLKLATTDFKIVQSIHRMEIVQVSKWWKELGLAKELKFARDQPLKWYLWTVASLADPSLSEERIELTKPISLVYIIDDIFYVHGTLDELTLFTNAVNKWNITANKEQLPDYLKICFKALDGITNEISHVVYRKHGWNPVDSLRKSWGKLCNAFLLEAQWFASGKLPNEEEYLKNAIVSSGVHVVLVHMFFLLGQGISKEAVNLLDDIPGLVSSTAAILRLWDDLGSAKDEYQNGHDGSYVECYMKKHQGCLVEEARDHVISMIKNEWERLNKECFSSKHFPMCFKKGCLNAARMVPIMYDYDDNHRLPGLEDYIKSLLSETIK